ncbi:hypothetical protein V8C35DRAFT_280290 [Trichoderma chlorosporum]
MATTPSIKVGQDVLYTPVQNAVNEDDTIRDTHQDHDGRQPTTSNPLSDKHPALKHKDDLIGQPSTTAPGWRRLLSNWYLEIICCILAVAALFAIVGTIYPYRGKPGPEWPNIISLNTLLAIYTMILKACLALVIGSGISQLQWVWFSSERSLHDVVKYNTATSGAWGSFQWLWAHKLRQPLTAFGAVITIVALAIDPFTQQLLSYTGCNTILEGSVAGLPRTNYFQGHGIASGTNIEGGPIDKTIEPALQAAINAGLFGTPYTVVPECSSGNCTFLQKYATLGYCTKCQDISTSITITNETCYLRNFTEGQFGGANYKTRPCSAETNASNITTALLNTDSVTFQGSTNLSITWDDGPASNNNPDVGAMQITESGITNPSSYGYYWTQVLIGKTSFSLQHLYPDGSGPIADCNGSEANSWSCKGYGAAQCTLQPCVREYSAAVNAGILQETLVNSTDPFLIWGYGDNNGTSNGAMAVIDTRCTTEEENAKLAAQGYEVNATRWLPYNVTIGYSNSPVAAPFSNCTYAIDYLFASDLYQQYLVDFFNGTITANIFNENFVVGEVTGPQPLQVMYNVGHFDFERVEGIFGNISDSMTAYIRGAGQAELSSPATGEVMHYDTCLQVQWGWLALPAALVFLVIIFLVWTIVVTAGQPVWKTSPLTMVFHGPWSSGSLEAYGLSQERAAQLETSDGMEDASKSIFVKIDRSRHPSRLVQVKLD